MIRTYSELSNLKTFDERFEYLKLNGNVADITFGFDRHLNQKLYTSTIWTSLRDKIIVRDLGCDLGLEGYDIYRNIIIHHMNPIVLDDIVTCTDYLLNPNYLICTSLLTHNAIHYGDADLLPRGPVTRAPNDTCPWK